MLYVVEQAGKIIRFENAATTHTSTEFLDIAKLVSTQGTEEGLLGLAFDPQFSQNGYFYVYYSAAQPRRSVIARYRTNLQTMRAESASATIIMEVAQPYSNHNGGMIAFGPDGMLYIALGDGGSSGDPHNHGQDLTTLLGSILRIDVRGGQPYSIPSDNPFVGRPDGARGEIWAYGLRNSWRFSFDRHTGALWAADVGQNQWEEIDIIVKGGNYGWRLFEGKHEYDNPQRLQAKTYIAPIHEYAHDESGGLSVTGGYVYRGQRVPALQGDYLYGDFVSGHVWALRYDGQQVTRNQRLGNVSNLASFGEDRDGEVYLVSLRGSIWKFE